MSVYKGKTFTINRSADQIVEKFSDLTTLREAFDKLPEEERQKVQGLEFEKDSIKVTTPQIGDIRFRVVGLNPSQITMKAEGTPVPLGLNLDMEPKDAEVTDATCSIDVDIPMMLRPLIAPQMQKAVDMISDMIGKAVEGGLA